MLRTHLSPAATLRACAPRDASCCRSAPNTIPTRTVGASRGAQEPQRQLRVQLVDPAEVPLANSTFRLYLPLGESVEGVTTAEGYIDVDDVPLGDHRVELERTTIFASASSRLDPTRRVLVVF